MAPELDRPRTSYETPVCRVSDAVWRCLFEESTDGLLIVDGAGHVQGVNARFLELTGLERADVLSQHTWSLLSSSPSPERVGGRLLMNGSVRCKDGQRMPAEIECRRLGDGTSLAIVRDKREHQRAEARIRDLTRLYALLSHVNQAVIRSRERQHLFQTVCDAAVEHAGFRLAWIGVPDAQGRVRPVAHAGQPSDYVLGLDIMLGDGALGSGPVGRVLTTYGSIRASPPGARPRWPRGLRPSRPWRCK